MTTPAQSRRALLTTVFALSAVFATHQAKADTLHGAQATLPAMIRTAPADTSTAARSVASAEELAAASIVRGTSPQAADATATGSVAWAHMEATAMPSAALAHVTDPEKGVGTAFAAHSSETAATNEPAVRAGSMANMEAPGSAMPAMQRMASIDPSVGANLAHSSATSVSGEHAAPDRPMAKPEAALPPSSERANAINPLGKSASQKVRTAAIATGPRGKTNNIRNRTFLKNPPN